MPETITLKWQGPLKIGFLPESEAEYKKLPHSAVYIWFSVFREGQGPTHVYAGKAEKGVGERLSFWYSFALSGRGAVYTEDGITIFSEGGNCGFLFHLQNNPDDLIGHGKADVHRARCVYAEVSPEHVRNVEALMIRNCMQRLPRDIFTPTNRKREPIVGEPPVLLSDQSQLHLDRLTQVERDRLITTLEILTAASPRVPSHAA